MMRPLIFVLLLCIPTFCIAQSTRFRLIVHKACAPEPVVDTNYSILSLSTRKYYTPKNGTVDLPGTGQYVLLVGKGPLVDSPLFHIADTDLFIKRYTESNLQLYVTGAFDAPAIYTHCDKPVNGYQEDHYPNGKIKVCGTFVNGNIKDSVVYYFENGNIEYGTYLTPSLTINKTYLPLGQIKSFRRYQHHSKREEITEFFTNGKLKLNKSTSKGLVIKTEYDDAGHLLLKQTVKYIHTFYPNQNKHLTYRWTYTRTSRPGRNQSGVYIVYRTTYDPQSNRTRLTVFEKRHSLKGLIPETEPQNADWIIKDVKYLGSKIISSVQDISAKEYAERGKGDE